MWTPHSENERPALVRRLGQRGLFFSETRPDLSCALTAVCTRLILSDNTTRDHLTSGRAVCTVPLCAVRRGAVQFLSGRHPDERQADRQAAGGSLLIVIGNPGLTEA